MKRQMFGAILAFIFGCAGMQKLSAQSYPFDQGSFLIGGGASLTSRETTYPPIPFVDGGRRIKQSSSHFSVHPCLQYFLIPGLALGGDISISRQTGGRWSLGGGPALTYFFLKGERPWNLYASGDFQVGKMWGSGFGKDPKFHSYGGAFGTVFMVSKGVGIHTEAFYTVSEWNEGLVEPVNEPSWESKLDTNEFGLAVGISVFVF